MKRKMILIVLAAFLLSGCGKEAVTVAGIMSEEDGGTTYIEMQEFELKEQGEEAVGEEVQHCVVLIPAGYRESEEISGMYVHERSPLDSSNIYYTISEGSGKGNVSRTLTEKTYKEMIEEAYRNTGQDVVLQIISFEEIDMDGIPGYKIRSSYKVEDEAEIEQLTYLILAKDTFTITYSQMSDDELMADFEISDGEIRLIRENSEIMAKEE